MVVYKALDLWLPAYLRRPRRPTVDGTTDLLLAVCDHFEPFHDADKSEALQRMHRWRVEFPRLIESYRDADGCRPRHTFFYPVEQHDSEILSRLEDISHHTQSEVELHLHHDGDTAAGLRDKLERGKDDLNRHHFLPRDPQGGLHYGFVHGNWALAHSHPQGRHCGVVDELSVLRQTGCYADFTMPSAPDRTQTRIINRLYYARSTGRPKPHDTGFPAAVGREAGPDDLLLVQGPLGLNWSWRKFGLLPRLENGAITGANPPTPARMRLWLNLGIHVQGRPEWVFIKLHTHGGLPRNMATLLGDPMRRFYDHLLSNYNDGAKFRLHFVTAREMVNILHAAEAGQSGDAGSYRNYRYRLK